jgi:hypothetical protein
VLIFTEHHVRDGIEDLLVPLLGLVQRRLGPTASD